jgi:hypothetical protein
VPSPMLTGAWPMQRHADLSQVTATYSHLVADDLFEAMARLHNGEE